MMKFLLQTVNGIVRHDFVLEMINAIEYHNWLEPNSMSVIYCNIEDIHNDSLTDIETCIPVGNIEFVFAFIDKYIKPNGSKEIKPLNVPEDLMEYEYSKRYIDNIVISDDISRHKWYDWMKNDTQFNDFFIKSNDTIKNPINDFYKIVDILDNNKIPNGNYQLSECINIVSEYRCFVYNNDLKGIQFYSGDFTKLPDTNKIYEMIDVYSKSAPKAYTLDIAITDSNKTCIIEAHEFFSCGLYGFSSYNHLPYMFKRVFDDIKKRING